MKLSDYQITVINRYYASGYSPSSIARASKLSPDKILAVITKSNKVKKEMQPNIMAVFRKEFLYVKQSKKPKCYNDYLRESNRRIDEKIRSGRYSSSQVEVMLRQKKRNNDVIKRRYVKYCSDDVGTFCL